jgi:tetratricopeptide (TPR) repeat protein
MTRAHVHRAIVVLSIVASNLAGASRPVLATEDGGTRSVFATGVGCRAMALGGAFAALSDDASGALWNPGGLGFVSRRELQIGHADLYADGVRDVYGALALPNWRWGVAAVSFRSFTVGGIEGRDDRNAVTDPEFGDQETEVMLSYGRQLGEAVGIGGNFKMRRHELAGYSASGVGLDLGILVRPGPLFHSGADWVDRTQVGLSIQNAARPSIRLDQDDVIDPITVRLGLAHELPLGGGRSIVGAVDFDHSPGTSTGLHAGTEFRLHPQFVLRGGMDAGDLTAGAGFRWHDLSFDYSFAAAEPGSQHRAGLSLRFGRSVGESRLRALAAQEAALQGRLSAEFAARQTARVDSLLGAAHSHLAAGDLESALSLIGVVSTLDPTNQRVPAMESACWRARAERLEQSDDLSGAALAWSQVMSLSPGDSAAARVYASLLAEANRRAARSQELRTLFDRALDAFTREDLTTARDGFLAILAADSTDAESARMLERTREATTRRIQSLIGEVDRLCRAGLPDAAENLLLTARTLDPRAAGLDAARAQIDRARTVRPTAPAVAPGSSTVAAGRPAAVVTPTRVDLTPERRREIEELYRRGINSMKADRLDEAVRFLEIVFEADPAQGQTREHLARVYLNRGMEAFAAGRLDDATGWWQKARQVDPTDTRAAGYLARAQAQKAKMQEILANGR